MMTPEHQKKLELLLMSSSSIRTPDNANIMTRCKHMWASLQSCSFDSTTTTNTHQIAVDRIASGIDLPTPMRRDLSWPSCVHSQASGSIVLGQRGACTVSLSKQQQYLRRDSLEA
jgi:hypothetical protein